MKKLWRFITVCFTGSAGSSAPFSLSFFQCAFVLGWIIFSHVFPHHAFDEYPFPLLAMILALEAVLLTSYVLTLAPSHHALQYLRSYGHCDCLRTCALAACDRQKNQRIVRYQVR